MLDAKWLLKNHKRHVARAAVVRLMLNREGVKRSEVREAMAFARPPLDGMPRAPGMESRTEVVACSLDERLRALEREASRRRADLERELKDLNWLIALYDAASEILSREEARLVQLHFQQGMSLEEIASRPLQGDGERYYSASTLGRMQRRVLEKVQDLLREG